MLNITGDTQKHSYTWSRQTLITHYMDINTHTHTRQYITIHTHCSSHQGGAVELQDDVLKEDQQVGWPTLH